MDIEILLWFAEYTQLTNTWDYGDTIYCECCDVTEKWEYTIRRNEKAPYFPKYPKGITQFGELRHARDCLYYRLCKKLKRFPLAQVRYYIK